MTAAAPMTLRLEGLCPLIQVYDMSRALAFYQDLLGFEVVQSAPPGESPDWAWLRRGTAELMLNTMFEAPDRPEAPEPGRIAGHADLCLFFGAPDVDAVHRFLTARGMKLPAPAVSSYGMRQLWLRDPDGYGICFQWSADQAQTGT